VAVSASTIVREIAVDLSQVSDRAGGTEAPRTHRAPASGFWGLFHAYADEAGVITDGFETCSAIVDRCIDLQVKRRALSLYSGWAGLGWMTTHLNAEEDSVAVQLDRLLDASLKNWPRRQGYDLIGGLVGVGVYFVERLPIESAKRGLELVLDRLQEEAVELEEGITWITAPEFLPRWQRERAPNGYYNLGVAHGVPGVCWLLAKVCEAGIEVARAERLLRRSLRWLRSNQPDPERAELPSWIAPGVDRQPNRRMAWCYGPLGAAAVTLQAANAICDRESIHWARSLALACAAVPPDQAQVRDAGLCHGAAGNAQIFYRLARNEGDAEFREGASAWFRATLNHRRAGEGVGGYRMWGDLGNDRLGWLNDGSFLTGSAGVGLALLAGFSEIEPKWDRLLLLS